MLFKEVFFSHPLYKGFYVCTIKDETGRLIWEGMPLLTALYPFLECEVVSISETNDSYTVVLKCSEDKNIDEKLLNEFIDETM